MNMKRMRGRNHRPGNGGGGGGGGGGGFRNQQNGIPLNRNHVFDSSGPEMRLRGTAQQLHEKYTQLARDASSNGDRVLGESYYQFAEHYFRIISAINQAQNSNGQQQPAPQNQQHNNNGYQNNDYQRGESQPEGEATVEPRYQDARPQEQRYQDRQQEPRYQDRQQQDRQQQDRQHQDRQQQEHRQQESRQHEPRHQEQRPQQEPRPQQEQRRNEQRNYEPRNKPDYQRTERYRPEAPAAVDTRIDISSALEAELAATIAPPVQATPVTTPPAIAKPPESRAIPIIPDAPPAAEAPKIPRPRGRPRLAKTEPKENAAD